MNNADIILSISAFVVLFSSWILASFKSGLTYFSLQSLLAKEQRKFSVDEAKIGIFVVILAASMTASIVFALIVTHGNFADALLYGAFNTLTASYSLAFWILLKEKSANTNAKK